MDFIVEKQTGSLKEAGMRPHTGLDVIVGQQLQQASKCQLLLIQADELVRCRTVSSLCQRNGGTLSDLSVSIDCPGPRKYCWQCADGREPFIASHREQQDTVGRNNPELLTCPVIVEQSSLVCYSKNCLNSISFMQISHISSIDICVKLHFNQLVLHAPKSPVIKVLKTII